MADQLPAFWGRKTFCLITGASRGIGRQMAVDFGKKVAKNSLFVLFGRSTSGLEETQDLVKKSSPDIHTSLCSSDLSQSDPTSYENGIRDSLLMFKLQPSSFDLILLVHNAGSIGDVTERADKMADAQKWLDYLSVNLVSTICLNSVVLKVFPLEPSTETCIVNVTSLCGIQPFKTMAHYCVGKASREMFFRVLALENPSMNVVSYSPGPVDTDMQKSVADQAVDPDIKEMFVSVRESGRILTTEQTVRRCVDVLAERKYKSGDHVDYFDEKY